jgi:hypothetical protein
MVLHMVGSWYVLVRWILTTKLTFIVWLSLFVSKAVVHFLPPIFQFLAGVVSPGVRKYYLIIQALNTPLSLVGWALTALLSFSPIFTRSPGVPEANHGILQPGFQTVMGELLGAALVCSLVFLAERFLIQLISINYHRKQFDHKIKENKRSVQLLALLYDASRQLFPAYCPEFQEEDYIINDAMNLSSLASKKSSNANPLRIVQNVGQTIGRYGDKVGAAFGTVAQELTGKRVFDLESGHSIVVEALEKNRSCEALARRLWYSFVTEGNEELYQHDIVEVLGESRREDAEEAFGAIDRDGNGDISLDEMILTITEIGRTRKSIASSMHDVDQAINVLDGLLLTVACIIFVFVIVAFVNKSFMTTLATTGTALLSLSFVFATTCQEVLGSCIFLFVKHPFDIGDRVDISTDALIVERISLLYTVFRRVQSGKVAQVPNIVLNTLWIDNITRSKAMREQISIFCDFATSFDDISLLKKELQTFVLDKENNRDFQPDVEIEVLSIAEMNKMELRVEIRHKSNWANESIRSARRSKFMCALVMALRRVPIYGPGGGDPPLGTTNRPSFSVSLDPETAQARLDAAAAAKDAKRLVPTAPAPVPESNQSAFSTGVQPEYLAAQNLNSRNVAVDRDRDDTWNHDDTGISMTRSSLDQGPGSEAGGDESRLLHRGESKASTSGLRPRTRTLETIAHHGLPPRGASHVTYAHPPTSTVPNRAAERNHVATEAVNAQTNLTNQTMASVARSEAFVGGMSGPSPGSGAGAGAGGGMGFGTGNPF